jgi:hypothetical protein
MELVVVYCTSTAVTKGLKASSLFYPSSGSTPHSHIRTWNSAYLESFFKKKWKYFKKNYIKYFLQSNMFNHVNLPVTVKPNHRTDSPTNCATTMVSQPIVHRWCGASCSTVDLDVSSPQIAQQEKKIQSHAIASSLVLSLDVQHRHPLQPRRIVAYQPTAHLHLPSPSLPL